MKSMFKYVLLLSAMALLAVVLATRGTLAAPIDPDTNPEPCDYDQGCGSPGTPPAEQTETWEQKIRRCSKETTWTSDCPNPRPSTVGGCGISRHPNPSWTPGGWRIDWSSCTSGASIPTFQCLTSSYEDGVWWPWRDAVLPAVNWLACWWGDAKVRSSTLIFGDGAGGRGKNGSHYPRVPGCSFTHCWNPDGGDMLTVDPFNPPNCQAVGCTDREQFVDPACPTESGAECECRPAVPDGLSIPVGASLAETVVSCVIR